ncbi:uncharacterized protein MELLADRAFT_113149 [Melampsora larici-populina 98AG31]|uniref:Uncharacterized protein n=1 Tax=Melampsora larici-populina (strain 98AG31 / pathotype 3-4-7) TaxID=747676 RepID=F4S8X1_MELLP|nr:uncharacterized protein MELLADRAFT_113149 [Melampsora larici-populina 98AG31]EGF98917.1 hypothetical protein MELLADRAFT_113149 [Melampsora larici-populina 98AG31]
MALGELNINVLNISDATTQSELAYEGVQKWTKYHDLFTKDLVITPIRQIIPYLARTYSSPTATTKPTCSENSLISNLKTRIRTPTKATISALEYTLEIPTTPVSNVQSLPAYRSTFSGREDSLTPQSQIEGEKSLESTSPLTNESFEEDIGTTKDQQGQTTPKQTSDTQATAIIIDSPVNKTRNRPPNIDLSVSPAAPATISLFERFTSIPGYSSPRNRIPPSQDPNTLSALRLDSAPAISVQNLQSTSTHLPEPTVEVRAILQQHEANYGLWVKAREAKDAKAFKHTTIMDKDLHRKLIKQMGYQPLLDHTKGWNPVEWDWTTFEKKIVETRDSRRNNKRKPSSRPSGSVAVADLQEVLGLVKSYTSR